LSKTTKRLVSALLFGLVAVLFIAGAAFSTASQKNDSVGRYLAVAPDLVLDTASGEVKDGAGQVILSAIEPNGSLVGKYHAAGFVTALTTGVATSGLGRQDVFNHLVKGISLTDTTTGRLVVSRLIYYNQPLTPEDLR